MNPQGDGELLAGVIDPHRVIPFERLSRAREAVVERSEQKALESALDVWFRLESRKASLEAEVRSTSALLDSAAMHLEALGCRRVPPAVGSARWSLPGSEPWDSEPALPLVEPPRKLRGRR